MTLTKEMALKATAIANGLSYLTKQKVKWYLVNNYQLHLVIKNTQFDKEIGYRLLTSDFELDWCICVLYSEFFEKDYPICLPKKRH